jgi:hypothetical protein
MNYADLIAGLPLPTAGQTAAFARHVTNVHSWYKHLPTLPPGARFTFFLNPHACEQIERDGDGFVVTPIEEGDYFRHGSRLSTADYRRRFGHWDYWSTRFRPLAPVERPILYGSGTDGRFELPTELVERWSCRLTAFLKLSPVIRETDYGAFHEYARARPNDPDVRRYQPVVSAATYDAQFAAEENAVQHQIVLQTLFAVLESLAAMSG